MLKNVWMLLQLTLEQAGAVASCPDWETISLVCDEDALFCVYVFWSWFIISLCPSSKWFWQPTVPAKVSKRGCEGNCWRWMRPSQWWGRTITKENLESVWNPARGALQVPYRSGSALWGGLSHWGGNSCPVPCCAGGGCSNGCSIPEKGGMKCTRVGFVSRVRDGEEYQVSISL